MSNWVFIFGHDISFQRIHDLTPKYALNGSHYAPNQPLKGAPPNIGSHHHPHYDYTTFQSHALFSNLLHPPSGSSFFPLRLGCPFEPKYAPFWGYLGPKLTPKGSQDLVFDAKNDPFFKCAPFLTKVHILDRPFSSNALASPGGWCSVTGSNRMVQ